MSTVRSNRWLIGIVGVVAAVMVVADSQWPAEGRSEKGKRVANVTLYNAEGDRIGRAQLKPARGGATRVQARITEAVPEFHGFHIHAVGECDPNATGGPFTSAGGHLAHGGQTHGSHAGDLPSLLVMEDGTARLELVTDRFEVSDLRDEDGSAVIVHAGRDNFANIPSRYVSTTTGQPGPDAATLATGDAGGRYACGVVEGG